MTKQQSQWNADAEMAMMGFTIAVTSEEHLTHLVRYVLTTLQSQFHYNVEEKTKEVVENATRKYRDGKDKSISWFTANYTRFGTCLTLVRDKGALTLKSGDTLILELEPTEDILASLGKMKRAEQLLIGFAAETDDMEKNALGKLQRKNLDWIAANRLDLPGQGAESNTNTVILFSVKGDQVKIPLSSKREVAEAILKITGINNAR